MGILNDSYLQGVVYATREMCKFASNDETYRQLLTALTGAVPGAGVPLSALVSGMTEQGKNPGRTGITTGVGAGLGQGVGAAMGGGLGALIGKAPGAALGTLGGAVLGGGAGASLGRYAGQ